MRFRVRDRGRRLEVEMTTYRLLDGEAITLISDGRLVTVGPDVPATVRVAAAPAEPRPAAASA